MKKLILTATIALAGMFTAAPEANAGPRFSITIGGGGSHFSSHRSCRPAPVYVLRTVEVGRQCKTIISHYLRCGTPVYRRITVVTYCSVYSNGYKRHFTRSFYS